MHFSLVRISTPHMRNTRCFDDVILPLRAALHRLGFTSEIRLNSFNSHSRNICFGANYDPEGRWVSYPSNFTAFNLEQLESSEYPWLKDGRYFKLLEAVETWDFSLRNVNFLAGKKIEAAFLPLGYVPEMSRLKPCRAPLSDVLFYGAVTPRRRRILTELGEKGLRVNLLTKAYGTARDQAIFSTRLLLNVHHSLPASLEIVRLGYVLANRRAVVSELAPDTYYYPELGGACAFSEYENLASTVLNLLAEPKRLEEQSNRGFELFSSLKFEDSLEKLIGRRLFAVSGENAPPPLPAPLHLCMGSGLNFVNEALNIDAAPGMNPDLVLDLSRPLNAEKKHFTARFGEVYLSPASFKCISLPSGLPRFEGQDVTMLNCLNLLEDGGDLHITVPYDLSEDAGGFRRSFNLKSFAVYVESLRHENTGFHLLSSELILSDYGRALKAKGKSLETISRAPRAVLSLKAHLRKHFFSSEENVESILHTRAIYHGPAIAWQVDAEEEQADVPLPSSALKLKIRLWRLKMKRYRYLFFLKWNLGRRPYRYVEKTAELARQIAELKRLLLLYEE